MESQMAIGGIENLEIEDYFNASTTVMLISFGSPLRVC